MSTETDTFQMQDEQAGNEVQPEEGFNPAQALARKSARRPALRGNILLIGLFVTGAATVYGLSLRRGPAPASAEEKAAELQVDSALLQLTQGAKGHAATNTQEVIRSFYQEVAQRQIPLNQLSKNPFEFVPPMPAVPTGTQQEQQGTKPTAAKQDPHPDPMAVLQSLVLQSVMRGGDRGASAIISGNLLTVGEKIEGFTIKAIAPKAVTLERKGREYVIHME